MVTEIRYSVNRAIVNKTQNFELLSTGYVEAQGTVEDIQRDIKNGHALCAGVVNGRRKKENFVGSQWVLLDIDNSQKLGDEKYYLHQLTIEEALENQFICDNCTFIYTTPSHTEEWNRFRLVFLMEEWISDLTEYEAIVAEVMKILPHDIACKDGVRVFYGNTEAQFYTPGGVLNSELINMARFNSTLKKAGNGKRDNDKWRLEYRQDKSTFVKKLKDALSYIPKRETGKDDKNYAQCMAVLAGVHWLFAGEGEDEIGKEIVREWSPEGELAGEKWNIEQKWRSFGFDKENVRTIGSVFAIAGEYGWKDRYVETGKEDRKNEGWKLHEKKRLEGANESELAAIRIEYGLNGEAYRELEARTEDEHFTFAQEEIKKTFLDDVDLSEFLNDEILEEYKIMYEGWGLKQAAILIMLLTGLSALFPTPTKVHIKKGGYKITPNMYAVHIAPSGAKKSAILNNLVSCGFEGINQSLSRQYTNKLAMWEAEDRKSRGSKPVQPIKLYTSPTSTKEGLSDIIREYPDLSQVGVFQELNAFIAQDSYSKNKGDVRDFIKQAYDGKGVQQVTRSNTISIENYQLSLATVVQPSVWFPYYNAEKDGDGLLCRFLVTEQSEMDEIRMDDDEENDRLEWTTKVIYDTAVRLLEDRPEIKFFGNTRKVYADYYYQIAALLKEETNDFLRLLLGKAQGHVAKLAINIHLLSEVMRSLKEPGITSMNTQVSADAVIRAYKVWEYSYGCMRRVHYKARTDSTGIDLNSKIIKLIEQGKNQKRDWTRVFCGGTNKTKTRDIDRAISYLIGEGIIEEYKDQGKRYRRK